MPLSSYTKEFRDERDELLFCLLILPNLCYVLYVPPLDPLLPPADAAAARALAWAAREQRAAIVLPDDWPALERACLRGRAQAARAITWLERHGWLQPIRRGAWAVRSRTLTLGARTLDLVGDLSGSPHLVTAGYALRFQGSPTSGKPHRHRREPQWLTRLATVR